MLHNKESSQVEEAMEDVQMVEICLAHISVCLCGCKSCGSEAYKYILFKILPFKTPLASYFQWSSSFTTLVSQTQVR